MRYFNCHPVFAALIAVFALAGGSANADRPAFGKAEADIISLTTISQQSPLQFNPFFIGEILNSSGAAIASPARILVGGPTSAAVHIQTPKTLLLESRGNFLRLSLEASGAPIALGRNGQAEITLGASVLLSNSHRPGLYRGKYRLTVVYN